MVDVAISTSDKTAAATTITITVDSNLQKCTAYFGLVAHAYRAGDGERVVDSWQLMFSMHTEFARHNALPQIHPPRGAFAKGDGHFLKHRLAVALQNSSFRQRAVPQLQTLSDFNGTWLQ